MNVLNRVQLDKWNMVTHIILFDPLPTLTEFELHTTFERLYDVRRFIPDVMGIYIKQDLTTSHESYPYVCLIQYISRFELKNLFSHPAYQGAYAALRLVCRRTAVTTTELSDGPVQHSIREATPREEREKMLVRDRLHLLVRSQLQIAEQHITPEASWVEDLDADSLDLVYLIMAVEEEFGVTIPDQEAERITTILEAEKILEKRRSISETSSTSRSTTATREQRGEKHVPFRDKRESVNERVQRIVLGGLKQGEEVPDPDQELFEESFYGGAVQGLVFVTLEIEFKMEIPDVVMDKLTTLRTITDYIQARLLGMQSPQSQA